MGQKKDEDLLYIIFEKHLYCSKLADENEESFVCTVVGEYMSTLQKSGSFPGHLLDDIKEDLATEVFDMLRKKIYGHYNLFQYRQTNKIEKN